MAFTKNRSIRLLGMGMAGIGFILFVLINYLSHASLRGFSIDLTDNQRYTLSHGSQAIVKDLDTPVSLKLYFSRQLAQKHPALTQYADRIIDLLNEYEQVSQGQVSVKVVEPIAFSEAEDEAVDYGLQGVPLDQTGSELFFGLVASNQGVNTLTIPFFQPEREAFLEYDISHLIYRLHHTKVPKVAVISSLPLEGQLSFMAPAQKPWVIWDQMTSVFDTKKLPETVEMIPTETDILVIAQPDTLAEPTLKAIDQYVMQGGKVLALLDPYSEFTDTPGETLKGLSPLLEAWGVTFHYETAVAHQGLANQVRYEVDGKPQVSAFPLWMTLEQSHISQHDNVTAQLQNLILASPGYFSKNEETKVSFEPLVSIPSGAMLLPADSVPTYRMSPDSLLRSYQGTTTAYPVAVRLTGEIRSAYENQTAQQANIILVGDSDFLYDQFWVQVQDFMGEYYAVPMAGNGHFILGALENLSGDNRLISIRNKIHYNRPFEKIQALHRDAASQFHEKEAVLLSRLDEIKAKIATLNDASNQATAGQALYDMQHQQMIDSFKAELLQTRKQLRQVRFDLNKDITKLENRIKFFNIFLMPIIIMLIGLFLHGYYFRRYPIRLKKKLLSN